MIFLIPIILLITLIVFRSWYNSPEQKGKRGEKYVAKTLSKLSGEYIVLNDLIFKTDKGTTQIDHLVLSKYGLFAIETKNYTGDIYGKDSQKDWTQIIVTPVTYQKKIYKTYTYVTKNKFYNPVKQAFGHIYVLKKLLTCYPYVPIIPIVVFSEGANLKGVNSRCSVIYNFQLVPTIKNFKSIYLNDKDVINVENILLENDIRQDVDNKTHIQNLRKAKTKSAKITGICPKCGGKLVKRSGKYGSFYGCSNYPDCKFIINI